jgi:hypothetical protein
MSTIAISAADIADFRSMGWTPPTCRMPSALLQPIALAAEALARSRPRQALLSGAHNPFGRAAALFDPWKFLDLCESEALLGAVEALVGPDLILWDSELYLDAEAWDLARRHEGRYWPVEPLAGLIADIALASGESVLVDVRRAAEMPAASPGAHYVIRYMPATSRYNRDPHHAANRRAMEERPLVNYQNRPIWLVRGVDRAGSDFATGFAPAAPAWAADPTFQKMEV